MNKLLEDAQTAESGILQGFPGVDHLRPDERDVMKKWEYLIVSVGDNGMTHDYTGEVWQRMDELGMAGWELVAVVTNNKMLFPAAYFKRPLLKVMKL